ncbi:MAG: Ig-like domain-containing protein [Prevotellaceae bacterium]|jgi:hypothetical protein|nr:Ig-like domain-containing protein [Prevotellaceae bacterium]
MFKLDKYFGKLSFLVLSVAVYGGLTMAGGGCANSSISPTGGAKDTIAPVLLNMTPAQGSKNFKGKEIVFTFNEYVQLKDQNKNFVISPPLPEKRPELRLKGKSVAVRFPVEPADSTTYYLEFGNSVVDLNESNPAQSLNFIFSTFDEIDSMMYAGVVVDAFTLAPVEGASVFLYADNIDSIPYKKNPSALSKSDKDGAFMIKGIKNINYKIVALLDANNNFRYDPASERIAFRDSTIKPYWLSAQDSIALADLPLLNMFTENAKRQALLEYKRLEPRLIQLVFNSINPQINKFEINGLTRENMIRETSVFGDTVKYWLKPTTLPDSIFASLIYMKTDSLNMLSPDTTELKFPVEKKKKESINRKRGRDKDKDKEDEEEEIIPITPNIAANAARIYENGIHFGFKTPLLRVDTSKIQLKVFDDTGKEKTPVRFTFERDSAALRNYRLNTAWKTAAKYELLLMPEAFVDIYGIANDSIVKSLETANPEKYGVLKIDVHNAEQQYIIQIIKDKKTVVQKIIHGNGVYSFPYLEAGKYGVRVIEDKNANGRWDTGQYLAHKQPERVVMMRFADDEDLIAMRASWEIEQTLDIKNIFK